MAPDKKSLFQTSLLHHTSTPSTLSSAFIGNSTVVYSAGRHLCYYNTETGNRTYSPLPDGVFAAKCVCASGKYVAVATSGIYPNIFLFKVQEGENGVESQELLFVIPKVAELDVTDMKFSGRNGDRSSGRGIRCDGYEVFG